MSNAAPPDLHCINNRLFKLYEFGPLLLFLYNKVLVAASMSYHVDVRGRP